MAAWVVLVKHGARIGPLVPSPTCRADLHSAIAPANLVCPLNCLYSRACARQLPCVLTLESTRDKGFLAFCPRICLTKDEGRLTVWLLGKL